MPKYDVAIVGAGLFGSVCAYRLATMGKRVIVFDKRNRVGGNCASEQFGDVDVHLYGPHVFHTSNWEIWNYVNYVQPFRAVYPTVRTEDRTGNTYSMPVNLQTFRDVFGCATAAEAREILLRETQFEAQKLPGSAEEVIIQSLGTILYAKLYKDVLTSRWGVTPDQLPPSIFKRLPVRMKFNDFYYPDDHRFYGVPVKGWHSFFDSLLSGLEVKLGCEVTIEDAFKEAKFVIYSGKLDDAVGKPNALAWRKFSWKHERQPTDPLGCAVLFRPDGSRLIQQAHWTNAEHSLLSTETLDDSGVECYPMFFTEDSAQNELYRQDISHPYLFVGGRLASYSYMDMDRVVHQAIGTVDNLLFTERNF